MNVNLDAIRSGAPLKDMLGRLPKIPTASAVSGLIVAALILMTPNPWFEAFILETGLPSVLGAAEPPLGARARIVFALVAALIVTSAAWLVLSFILNRKQRDADSEDYAAEFGETEEPSGFRAGTLRRADAHPDAPYRRPIMAEDDLGAPLDLVDLAPPETDADESASNEEPLDLGEVAEVLAEDGDAAENEQTEPADAETDSEPEVAEPVSADAAFDVPEPEPVFEIPLPSRDAAVEEDPAPVEPARFELPEDTRTELARLVDRLEAGLERKRARERAAGAPKAENVTPHPQAEPSRDRDAALREALETLQQATARQR
ncbi:MAG: hypothetical protein ACTS1Z_02735 [Parasphingopyxis sp.]|uniref:hypothetical protein n=1 Tax=Parasphingopyxis sp. TaxID=1920299 RepID=UPI003FA03C76